MAADAGLNPTNEEVVAISGTGRGADPALRTQPAHAANFLDLKIREVAAKTSTF
jgi:hypothetical protein